MGNMLRSFRSLDIFLGSASFIPILLYTLFLDLFIEPEVASVLPGGYVFITKWSLRFLIAVIIAVNELASFLNISYPVIGDVSAPVVLSAFFTNAGLHSMLDAATLIFLALYQLFIFFVMLRRLMKVLAHKQALRESKAVKQMETHHIRGVGWIAGSLLLGASEVLIGLAQGTFAVALARRIIRMVARTCLVVGVVQGIDTVEDFDLFNPSDARLRRRSKFMALISNPRQSSFVHVTGLLADPEGGIPEPFNPHMSVFSDPHAETKILYLGPSTLAARRSSATIETEDGGKNTPSDLDASTVLAYSAGNHETTTKSTGAGVPSRPAAAPNSVSFTMPAIPTQARTRAPDESQPVRRERVTVHYGRNDVPFLELRRFSDIDFRPALQHVELQSDPAVLRARSLPLHFRRENTRAPPLPLALRTDRPFVPTMVSVEEAKETDSMRTATTLPFSDSSGSIRTRVESLPLSEGNKDSIDLPKPRITSVNSAVSDSLEVIRSLADQFPGIPPRVHSVSRRSRLANSYVAESSGHSRAASDTSVGEYQSQLFTTGESFLPIPAKESNSVSVSRTSSTSRTSSRSDSMRRKPVPSMLDFPRGLPEKPAFGHDLTSIITIGQSVQGHNTPDSALTPEDLQPPAHHFEEYPPWRSPSPVISERKRRARTLSAGTSRRPRRIEADALVEFSTVNVSPTHQGGSDNASSRASIKSIGSVARRVTPNPVLTEGVRGSIVVEWDELPSERTDAIARARLSRDRVRRKLTKRRTMPNFKPAEVGGDALIPVPVPITDRSVFED
ncbi:hypothetical protein OBBRIDRAFT_831686 [Obba rivulosa]|uniref:Uncharacterized protein n=1 Tax=Obba rivulosa TaxID=1052685 RepID=A0A8E2J4U5_9APHY|nr:hypothetical protein OBBRIDRAFT_831686 [Obba rivulosa]